MKREDAEEYTQALGQVVAGGWRQIALGHRLGVPHALGLSTQEWVQQRIGGYVRLSLEERRRVVKELTAPTENGGMAFSNRQAAEILGVSRETVRADANAGKSLPSGEDSSDDDEEARGKNLSDDPLRGWSDREAMLRAMLERGETVVVSFKVDQNLIAWAQATGRFVRIDRETEWGNPFETPDDGDRPTVVENYEHHYLPHKPSLLRRVGLLRGQALGCWCAPALCHGDVLKRLVEERTLC